MLKRSSILNIFLLTAALLIGFKIYTLFQEEQWEFSKAREGKGLKIIEELKDYTPGPQLYDTQNIIAKNIFDPDRGEGRMEKTMDIEITQPRLEDIVLMGTFVKGDERYAILQFSSAPGRAKEQARFKLGDMVEGFQLTEIDEKKVVLKKGSYSVDLSLDFFFKVEEPGKRAIAQAPTRSETTSRIPQIGSRPSGTEKFLSNFSRIRRREVPPGGTPQSQKEE